jgi:hypothetical protein
MAHPELAADLFHIDSMAFVRQARIPRDDKEPADTAEGSDDLLGHSAQVKTGTKPADTLDLSKAANLGPSDGRNRDHPDPFAVEEFADAAD